MKALTRFTLAALLAAFLLPASFAQSSVEIPATKSGPQSVSVSGTTIRVENASGVLLPTFAEKITGAPSTVSIVIQGCMTGDVQGDNCTTLETNTATTGRQIRHPSTNSTVYDYFLITPTWTGGTSTTVTINSTLSPNARNGGGLGATTATDIANLFSGCSGTQYLGFDGACHTAGGAPSGSAGGDLTGTYPNPTIASGAVTDAKASLAVKPAVTVVASANTALSGLLTIDSVVTADGSIVLATAQTSGSENGPWVVHSGAWTRPTWYTSGSTTQAPQFLTTFVRLGTAFQGSTWRMTTAAVTIDSTATTWTQTPTVLSASSVLGALPAAQMPAFTGDCATSAGAVATICTKTNGASFAASATSDATNAANIASGTLPAGRLPALTGDATSSVNTAATTVKQAHWNETAITNASSPYTVLSTDSVITCNATAGAVIINLPAATGTGRYLTIKKTDSSANACTPTRAGSDLIDGASTYSLTVQYAASAIVDTASAVWSRTHVNQLAGDTSGASTANQVTATHLSSPLPEAQGGTAADLSATGGTSQFLKQASSGAAITVVRPACADLSNAAASCSSDTTNAANISSGALAVARGGSGGANGALSPIIFSSGGNLSTAVANYFGISTAGSSGEAFNALPWPVAGTISNCRALYRTAAALTSTMAVAITFRKNYADCGSPGAITITLNSGSSLDAQNNVKGSDTTNSCAVAAGDSVVIKSTPSNTPSAAQMGVSCQFQPN